MQSIHQKFITEYLHSDAKFCAMHIHVQLQNIDQFKSVANEHSDVKCKSHIITVTCISRCTSSRPNILACIYSSILVNFQQTETTGYRINQQLDKQDIPPQEQIKSIHHTQFITLYQITFDKANQKWKYQVNVHQTRIIS